MAIWQTCSLFKTWPLFYAKWKDENVKCDSPDQTKMSNDAVLIKHDLNIFQCTAKMSSTIICICLAVARFQNPPRRSECVLLVLDRASCWLPGAHLGLIILWILWVFVSCFLLSAHPCSFFFFCHRCDAFIHFPTSSASATASHIDSDQHQPSSCHRLPASTLTLSWIHSSLDPSPFPASSKKTSKLTPVSCLCPSFCVYQQKFEHKPTKLCIHTQK